MPTARRDLEALAQAGIPIYPTRGRGGGWRLVGGARTDLTGLSEGEVTSLLIGLSQSATDEPDRTAAVRKLLQAAPAPFRETAQRIADATVRDVPWGEVQDAGEARTVAALQRAIARRLRVHLEYDGSRAQSSVDVVPLIVGSRGHRWYLLGAPVVDEDGSPDLDRLRTFRVDRILTLEILTLPGTRPDSFDAQRAWERMIDRVEDLRGSARATVRVQPWAVRALCDRFGVQARILDAPPDADGRTLVEVSAHRTDALAEQLAGWTSVVEVVGPHEVRGELRELGERIVAQYANAEDCDADRADGANESPVGDTVPRR